MVTATGGASGNLRPSPPPNCTVGTNIVLHRRGSCTITAHRLARQLPAGRRRPAVVHHRQSVAVDRLRRRRQSLGDPPFTASLRWGVRQPGGLTARRACTVAGNLVTLTGGHLRDHSAPGWQRELPAAADVERSFASARPQTITFAAPVSPAVFASTFIVTRPPVPGCRSRLARAGVCRSPAIHRDDDERTASARLPPSGRQRHHQRPPASHAASPRPGAAVNHRRQQDDDRRHPAGADGTYAGSSRATRQPRRRPRS